MKKLIFDIDGTILDSMHIWVDSEDEILEKYGYKREDLSEEQKNIMQSSSFEGMCNFLAEEIAYDMTGDEILSYLSEKITYLYSEKVMPVPGGKEILKSLKNEGFSMAIASSTSYRLLEKALKRLELYDYFDFIVTPDQIGIKKSKPEYWQYCIDKYRVAANELILFDDALYAIEAAGKEGIITVGVRDFPWNKDDWDLIKKEANYTIESIAYIDIERLKD